LSLVLKTDIPDEPCVDDETDRSSSRTAKSF